MFNTRTPKTFCYVNWDFPNIRIESLSWDVEFRTDIPDYPGLYFQLDDGHVSDTGKYFGFQTNVDGGVGRGVIYSRWGPRDCRLGRAAEGVTLIDLGHEGDFISLRKPYRWGKGSYRVDFDVVDEDGQGQWYGLSWLDKQTGKRDEMGSILFPHGAGNHNGFGTWLELYTQTYRPEMLPTLEYTVDCVANGGIRPEFVRVAYRPEETGNANVVIEPEYIVIQAGQGIVPTTLPGQHRR